MNHDLTFHFEQYKDQWTGECIELGVGAYGNTLIEAREALFDIVIIHLKALRDVKDGTMPIEVLNKINKAMP